MTRRTIFPQLGSRWLRRALWLSLPALLLMSGGSSAWRAVRDGGGHPISCPDPSVVKASGAGYRYLLVCTTDFDPNAFPIRGSDDLRHWQLISYVFPAHKQPWWAVNSPQGRFWAPALYRIGNRWVVYFAAQYNSRRVRLHPADPESFVVGVATASSLTGPWHTRILHYRGQFNRVNRQQESYGGVIDPAMAQDPRSGQRYLVWAEQHSSLWVGRLSSDGTQLDRRVHMALWVDGGWDCSRYNHACVVEGPTLAFRNGWFYLFYSGAGTWDGTYSVGVAVSRNPMQGVFTRLSSRPLIQAQRGWVSTGGQSAPVRGPDGKDYLFFHGSPGANPAHDSADRFLLYSRLEWQGIDGFEPVATG